MPGAIIVINGTSRSGKTSIARALPERYLERPLWDDVLGKANRPGQCAERIVERLQFSLGIQAFDSRMI